MGAAGHAATLEDFVLVLFDYLRVSADNSGRLRSPAEQHADNARDAASIGAVMGDSYAEEGARSASRYQRKKRDAFQALAGDIASGAMGRRAVQIAGPGARAVLQLWTPGRGSRKVGEWVALIDACEAAGVLIRVTKGRTYDAANARDRKELLRDAVDAEYFSSELSAQVKRALDANAAAGMPHGRCPYGFRREYEVTGGGKRVVAGQVPDPDTAPIVREIFLRIARGESMRSIADDLNARKVPTVTGGPWSQPRVGGIARNHAYGGRRMHFPGSGGKHPKPGEGTLHEAMWEPLVRMDLYYAVTALMGSADRRQPPGREVHLLGSIAECGTCGGPVSGRKYPRGVVEYWCVRRGCTWMPLGVLDEYVTGLLIARLSRPDVYDQLAAGGADDPALQQAEGSLAELEARHRRLAAEMAAEEITPALAGATERILLDGIADARRTVQALRIPPLLQRFMGGASSIAEAWDAATLAAKRELIRAYFGHIRIMKRDSFGARVAQLTLTGTAPDGQPVTIRAGCTFPFGGIVRSDGSSWETVARGRKEHLVAGREWAVIPLACDPMVVERTDYEWRE